MDKNNIFKNYVEWINGIFLKEKYSCEDWCYDEKTARESFSSFLKLKNCISEQEMECLENKYYSLLNKKNKEYKESLAVSLEDVLKKFPDHSSFKLLGDHIYVNTVYKVDGDLIMSDDAGHLKLETALKVRFLPLKQKKVKIAIEQVFECWKENVVFYTTKKGDQGYFLPSICIRTLELTQDILEADWYCLKEEYPEIKTLPVESI